MKSFVPVEFENDKFSIRVDSSRGKYHIVRMALFIKTPNDVQYWTRDGWKPSTGNYPRKMSRFKSIRLAGLFLARLIKNE